MDQSCMYKGTERKLFDNDKVEQAEADGWFDNPTDAQKPKTKTAASASGAVTTKAAASGAITGKI